MCMVNRLNYVHTCMSMEFNLTPEINDLSIVYIHAFIMNYPLGRRSSGTTARASGDCAARFGAHHDLGPSLSSLLRRDV